MRVLIGLIFALAATAIHAQPSSVQKDDEMSRTMLMLALDNIHRARCESAKPCKAATAEEKADPPINRVEAKAVIDRAVFSAAAEHCGLDWQARNFVPMMAYWRTAQKKTNGKWR